MTLIVAAMCNETIWLLADRRLSRRGQVVMDDARKVMTLETTDGIALLGYAGLGATALGTEPSDWMSNVLRGRNLPLEASLSVLANAVKAQLPRHLKQIGHTIIVPAFVGGTFRLYTIGFDPQRNSVYYTRHAKPWGGGTRTWPFAIGGSGALHLIKQPHWKRPLLHLMRAHGRSVLSAHAVADHLAKLNFDIAMRDQTVGQRCIVVWRHRRGGGAHRFYSGTGQDQNAAEVILPTIARGGDIGAIMSIFAPRAMKAMHDWMEKGGDFEPPDEITLNKALSKLPRGPNENLK